MFLHFHSGAYEHTQLKLFLFLHIDLMPQTHFLNSKINLTTVNLLPE